MKDAGGAAVNEPRSSGESERPRLRAMLVSSPAAERSAARTSHAMYACLAGTSLCEIVNRRMSIASMQCECVWRS